MTTSCSATYFSKVGKRFSLKVATKASFENLDFQATFLKQKRIRATIKHIFGITIRSSATYYPELSAYVPQKVDIESSVRGKNTPKIQTFKLIF